MASIRAHVFISGRVQGVMFRESTRREAAARGVLGWVQNLSDGRVEAVFEGDQDAVEAVVRWCRRGPSRADVDDVDVEREKATGEFDRFEIRQGWAW